MALRREATSLAKESHRALYSRPAKKSGMTAFSVSAGSSSYTAATGKGSCVSGLRMGKSCSS